MNTSTFRPLLLLGLLAGLAACSGENAPSGPPGGGTVEVGFVTLKSGPVPITVEIAGRTTASAVADIRPQVDGIIKKRVFTEGSTVKTGDLLYEIDPRTYQATYDSAAASLQKAEAAVPSAQAKVDRYNQLVGVNSVTAQSLDDAKATLAQAKADVAAAQAALEAAEINLGFTNVKAPIGGLIGTSTVTEGALVTANQTTALATIRQIDPIYVDVTDSTTSLLRIRAMLDSGRLQRSEGPPPMKLILDDGSTYDQTGTLQSSEATVSQTTGTFSMRATFANPTRQLLPGMYVRAIVSLGDDKAGFLVPQRAVDRNAKGAATAMFLTSDNKVETRILDTVQAVGNNWLVDEGIKDGDRLIVDGLQKIRDGAAVTPVAVTLDENGVVKSEPAASGEKETAK
ncbi:efflux RND transporter periplasmic adaptor subunit [Mesorhizobium sp. BR1-1-16]|uniref:efflux RND transporter periplasmic adaptor subunit n=1 Tax=Mesorhizobium sp. BR1-1-16 TaxID=2876653 RepID=UPI001CCE2DDC|nr:efflux RND transporter periplasmic adaptor subunit [Mesorhizobium sp. BR1-1-16]MBZ9935706.1 efflux RND transporter periplasmic adaptor subunit [Mesorhizobium sp. BR1-1-16]